MVSLPDKKIKIAIVGGGIGGVVLAIGLLKYPHITVNIYESSLHFATIGAGISIGNNALRALEVVNPEARKLLQDTLTHNLRDEQRDWYFSFRIAQDHEGKDVDVVQATGGLSSFHRAKLLERLASLLPEDMVSFGKKMQSITEDNGVPTVHFDDGTAATADCVIGVDGIHSLTREYIVADRPETYSPTYTGIHVCRALVPMEEARAAVGTDLCSRGFLHLSTDERRMSVTYPIENHTFLNLAVIDMTQTEQHGSWVRPADFARLDELFANWAPNPRRLVKLVEREGTAQWAVHDLPDLPTFVRGRVAILGDAAHAMTPSLGAGAGQAVEDACVMQALLGRAKRAEDLDAALRAYDTVRRPAAQAVRRASRLSTTVMSMCSPEYGADIHKIIGKTQESVSWVSTRDMNGQTAEALRVFDAFRH